MVSSLIDNINGYFFTLYHINCYNLTPNPKFVTRYYSYLNPKCNTFSIHFFTYITETGKTLRSNEISKVDTNLHSTPTFGPVQQDNSKSSSVSSTDMVWGQSLDKLKTFTPGRHLRATMKNEGIDAIRISPNGLCCLLSQLVAISWVTRDNPRRMLSEMGYSFLVNERKIVDGSIQLLEMMCKGSVEKSNIISNILTHLKKYKNSSFNIESPKWFIHQDQDKIKSIESDNWLAFDTSLGNENTEGDNQTRTRPLFRTMLNVFVKEDYPVFIFQITDTGVPSPEPKSEKSNVIGSHGEHGLFKEFLFLIDSNVNKYQVSLFTQSIIPDDLLEKIGSLTFLFKVVAARKDTCLIYIKMNHFTTLVPSSSQSEESSRTFRETIGKISISLLLSYCIFSLTFIPF